MPLYIQFTIEGANVFDRTELRWRELGFGSGRR
jgi:hypothetical protein